MKKIIVMSITVSALLFGASVDKLTLDLENTVSKSKINAATISQGETNILGDANVEDLTISKKQEGNIIYDTLVNSTDNTDFRSIEFEELGYYDRERDDTIISQGRTLIIDGKVSNVKIDSDSIINRGTSINSALGNSVKIDQGLTLIEGAGQKLINAKISSENFISNVEIEGDGTGETHIKQGNFIMENDGAASTAINITLKSINNIEGGKVGHANIKQAVTELEKGGVLHDTNLHQTNIIAGETEIKDFSEVSQATTEVEEYSVASIQQEVYNVITDVEGESSSAQDSKIQQADIHIEGDSRVSLTFEEHRNAITSVQLEDSSITQDTTNIKDHSIVENFRQRASNDVHKSNLKDSMIKQNNVFVQDSLLWGDDALVSVQENLVADSTLTDSYISQADVMIIESKVLGLTVSEQNTVYSSELNNATLTQGKLLISGL
jgi:hypothetical protein